MRSDDLVSIYRAVCDSMTCGVLLIDGQGRIETFNPAASRLLGLDRDAVLHRSFAEVFFADDALDELNEAILAAIHGGAVGQQRMATVSVGGRPVPLAVDTSYLREPSGGRDGRRGVVAVFSDISELESLRAKEIALAKDVEAKHRELQDAYRSLEDRNTELGGLLRRVRAVRLASSICGAAIAIGLGAWLWDASIPSPFGAPPTQAAKAPGETRLLAVEPRRIASTIDVTSTVEPLRRLAVASPFEGKVGTVHAKLGESVAEGQPLLTLDVSEVRIQHRKAQAAWLKAEAEMEGLKDWSNGPEASRAK
ncbi:MAG: PAS domain-containing protein, partial [Rhodospirillaceae bacterium]|nr:PAS domain-containing protein [Rhodospirillaceae bacterium]